MIDGTDILALEQRLAEAVDDLSRRSDAVALSRQIREFNADQRKNLLATYTAPLLKDNSATAAEILARANPQYQEALTTLETCYYKAEKHLATYDAAYAKFEAARSLLSMARQQLPAGVR